MLQQTAVLTGVISYARSHHFLQALNLLTNKLNALKISFVGDFAYDLVSLLMNVLRRSRKICSLRVNYGTQGHGLVAHQLKDLPGKIHEVTKEGSLGKN